MRKLVVVALAVVLAALGGVVYWMTGRSSAPQVAQAGASGAGSSSGSPSTSATLRPPTKVTRIDQRRRQQLAEQIKRAQEARAAAAAGSAAPSTASPPKRVADHEMSQPELDALKTPLMDALKDIEPMIKECWKQAMPERPDIEIKAAMFMSGDPDIGTLVDSQDVTDHDGKPLPQKLADCVYDVFTGIELPPLREGDKVKFTSVITLSHAEDGSD